MCVCVCAFVYLFLFSPLSDQLLFFSGSYVYLCRLYSVFCKFRNPLSPREVFIVALCILDFYWTPVAHSWSTWRFLSSPGWQVVCRTSFGYYWWATRQWLQNPRWWRRIRTNVVQNAANPGPARQALSHRPPYTAGVCVSLFCFVVFVISRPLPLPDPLCYGYVVSRISMSLFCQTNVLLMSSN